MDGATSPEKSCRQRKGAAILLVPRRQRDRDARVLRARDQASVMPFLRAVVLPGLGAIAVLAAAGRAIRMLDGDDPDEDRAVRGSRPHSTIGPTTAAPSSRPRASWHPPRSWDGRDRRTCGGPSNLTQRRRSPPATRRRLRPPRGARRPARSPWRPWCAVSRARPAVRDAGSDRVLAGLPRPTPHLRRRCGRRVGAVERRRRAAGADVTV